MIDFERAFDDLEKAADSALEAAKELEKQAKTLQKTAKDRNINAIKKSRPKLDTALGTPKQTVINAVEAWPFNEEEVPTPGRRDRKGGRHLSRSCPTVVIGHPESFLFPVLRYALSCPPPWISPEDGFPLKTAGMTDSVMPDGCYRASRVLSLPRPPVRPLMPAPLDFP